MTYGGGNWSEGFEADGYTEDYGAAAAVLPPLAWSPSHLMHCLMDRRGAEGAVYFRSPTPPLPSLPPPPSAYDWLMSGLTFAFVQTTTTTMSRTRTMTTGRGRELTGAERTTGAMMMGAAQRTGATTAAAERTG